MNKQVKKSPSEEEVLKLIKDYTGKIIVGGKGDNITPEKIIKDYDLNQIKMGIDVEYEHTNDPATALEIVMDHLTEIKNYYSYLAVMESVAKGMNKKIG